MVARDANSIDIGRPPELDRLSSFPRHRRTQGHSQLRLDLAVNQLCVSPRRVMRDQVINPKYSFIENASYWSSAENCRQTPCLMRHGRSLPHALSSMFASRREPVAISGFPPRLYGLRPLMHVFYFAATTCAGAVTFAIFSRFASCCSSRDSSNSRPFSWPDAQISARNMWPA